MSSLLEYEITMTCFLDCLHYRSPWWFCNYFSLTCKLLSFLLISLLFISPQHFNHFFLCFSFCFEHFLMTAIVNLAFCWFQTRLPGWADFKSLRVSFTRLMTDSLSVLRILFNYIHHHQWTYLDQDKRFCCLFCLSSLEWWSFLHHWISLNCSCLLIW